jgi:peptidoglycan/xylan/chitin deacetylase (PgdA/CDA1 family)
MNWTVWSKIEASLTERKLRPILAVVPDNQDPVLQVEPAVPDFWERVRAWQTRGWTIALHGYQHRYVGRHPGIVTVTKKTEFAGLPAAEQESKLQRGLEIFERHGVKSRLWIAPSNSFDRVTVSLLPKLGISMICDGYFRSPHLCQRNMFWIPQQLFCFRPAPAGVWTVCYHHNQWLPADLSKFQQDLDDYGPDISSVDEVVAAWGRRRSRWSSFLCRSPRLSPLLIRCHLKWVGWRRSRSAWTQPATRGSVGLPTN